MIRLRELFSIVAMVALVTMTTLAVPVCAQDAAAPGPQPIGLFAADVRLTLPKYKGSADLASALGVDPQDLPTRGLGLVFGAHLYPARKGVVTLGIGAELMTSGRSRTAATTAATAGPTTHTHFSSFSPQVSLNFGSKQGWSYISGGLGWGRFKTELETKPLPDAAGQPKIINYGGGARWFVNDHMAVSLDLRFYAVNPQEASQGRPAFPRMTSMTFSAGVGLK